MRSTRCERSREAISLRLDGMLSMFESALLDRHLRGCASCRAFAAGADAQTGMLRAALLEEPERRVVISTSPTRRLRRSALGVASATLAAAAAALVFALPSISPSSNGGGTLSAARAGEPVMVSYPAAPSPASATVEVPRLRVEPESIADGPVHGLYNTPAFEYQVGL